MSYGAQVQQTKTDNKWGLEKWLSGGSSKTNPPEIILTPAKGRATNEPANLSGMNTWYVGGPDQLSQQWFFYWTSTNPPSTESRIEAVQRGLEASRSQIATKPPQDAIQRTHRNAIDPTVSNTPSPTNLPGLTISSLTDDSRVEYNAETRITVITNGGVVQYKDTVVQADVIELNHKTSELKVTGNYRVQTPTGITKSASGAMNIFSNEPPRMVEWPRISTNEKRKNIADKLSQIRLKRIAFDAIPLRHVVTAITAEARRLDPEGRGVNILINPSVSSPEDGDISASKITINSPLTNVRLIDALNAILKCADKPLKLSIEEYAAVISLKGQEPTPLFMREFKVEPAAFANWMAAKGFPFEKPTSATNSTPESIRNCLANAGINLDPMQGKSIFYNDRAGILLIRATMEELDRVEQLVLEIDEREPQINTKAQFFEAPPSQLEAFIPDIMATTKNSADQSWAGVLSKLQLSQILQCTQTKSVSLLSDGEVTISNGQRAQLQALEVKTIVTGINPNAPMSPGINTNIESVFITSTNLPFGTQIELISTITPDGYSVAMTVMPSLTEFLGYEGIEHPTNTVVVYQNGKKTSAVMPQPRIRTQQMTNAATVPDGRTLMLVFPPVQKTITTANKVPVLGDIPGIGRLFRSRSSQTQTNVLFVLITPTIVAPASKPPVTSATNRTPNH